MYFKRAKCGSCKQLLTDWQAALTHPSMTLTNPAAGHILLETPDLDCSLAALQVKYAQIHSMKGTRLWDLSCRENAG